MSISSHPSSQVVPRGSVEKAERQRSSSLAPPQRTSSIGSEKERPRRRSKSSMSPGLACEGDLIVYTRASVPGRNFFNKGKWVRVHGVLYETGVLTVKATAPGDSFEQMSVVGPGTTVSVGSFSGRQHCLVLTGFDRLPSTKRVFDCGKVEARNKWQTKLIEVSAKPKAPSSSSVERGGSFVPPTLRKKSRSLESFLLWHEEYYRSTGFKLASAHRRRWWRAIDSVARDVLKRRNEQFGYTSLELIRLQKKIVAIEKETIGEIKRKARRILRKVSAQAKRHGGKVEHGGEASTRSAAKDYRDSAFKKQLQVLLRRERVLVTLTRTLELIRRKERGAFVLADAMRGLWVARCVRALFNLPGGLAALLAMSQERGTLRRLLAAALLCRVPLLTTLVLEMLGALALLPGREGLGVATSVLATVDRGAKWGQAVCSDFLMRPSTEALRWSPSALREPPPFATIATLLHVTPEHDCCPELRCAVVTLFAALCRSQLTRSEAQWMQARIFLACRAALRSVGREQYARLMEKLSDTPTATETMKRAQMRRVSLGRDRNSKVAVDAGEDVDFSRNIEMHPCPPLLEHLINAQSEEHAGGDNNNNNDNKTDSSSSSSSSSSKLFALQLEHFMDGWDHRELDESDEIDELPVGSAERTELLAERIRRSALLLGRYVHVDDALHALGLDLEHAAFLPFRILDARQKAAAAQAAQADDDDGDARLRLDLHATAAAIAKLQSAPPSVDARRQSSDALRQQEQPQTPVSAVKKNELALKDDPKFGKFFKMIKLHIPKMAVAAKMASEGLDPAILDRDPNSPAPKDATGDTEDDDVEEDDDDDHPGSSCSRRMTLSSTPGKDDADGGFKDVGDAEAAEAPVACARGPRKRLRRVFWDVIGDSEGTWWDTVMNRLETSGEKEAALREYFLDSKALEELESVFGQTRLDTVIRADNTSSEIAQQKERLATQLVVESESAKALVAEALGVKRAFALNLLYGSLRLPNDECVSTVAELDPKGTFISNLPLLGTLYNIVERTDELASIERAAINAGILSTKHGALSRSGDAPELDGLSELMVSLIERARRPRAKVRALWLRATVKDSASDILAQIKNLEATARAVSESTSLRKLMCVVLSITNFVNHGSDRGRNRGVRLGALAKLRSTKTTSDSGGYKNLLQFVVRHAGVPSHVLKTEIPLESLRSVHAGASRATLSANIDQLTAERDDAANERSVLSREATTQNQAVDARRIAVAAAAAARMAHIVADIDDELTGLRQAFKTMDDFVDSFLSRFGEPTTSVDALDWFRDLDTFITQYDAEYVEYREHTLRKERRERLAKKQLARETYLAVSDRQPSEPRAIADVPLADPPADDATKPVKEFDKALESAQRAALLERPRIFASTRSVASSARLVNVRQLYQPNDPKALACAECKINTTTTMPGAYSKADNTWYCADCWYEFSFKSTDWKVDFGEETKPSPVDDDHADADYVNLHTPPHTPHV
ncbi:hypothetical protein CTAYLR_001484 [Chrysophaeum taylorii]|uniref:FH2 domain-containing protein n=1 Tax=Chrysophaeum taylorii TaxID=2483200 RepID=A0AAD7UFX1_9STRA|nr:hypothetical protein CTAYLR_001484 [Chrysophaeum taylorii]